MLLSGLVPHTGMTPAKISGMAKPIEHDNRPPPEKPPIYVWLGSIGNLRRTSSIMSRMMRMRKPAGVALPALYGEQNRMPSLTQTLSKFGQPTGPLPGERKTISRQAFVA